MKNHDKKEYEGVALTLIWFLGVILGIFYYFAKIKG